MTRRLAGCNLHLLHSWGGGLQRWVRLFAVGDRRLHNLVLSSSGTVDAYGLEIVLWDASSGEELRRWSPQEPICEIALENVEYEAALRSVVSGFGIERVFVSSLIGHSLDALACGVPIAIVHHDFFPFCPALNLHYGGMCGSCGGRDLARCLAGNPHAALFRGNSPSYWVKVRDRYFELLRQFRPVHVCPHQWVAQALRAVDARFSEASFEIIEHGLDLQRTDCFGGATRGRRLRVVHLGHLTAHKGLPHLRVILPRLRLLADVTLLGTGPAGAEFEGMARVNVLQSYQPGELPERLRDLRPDLALFLSDVPETYSFTLSEAIQHGIPAVARRLGSFAHRIDDGRTGLLFDDDEACLAQVERLDRKRSVLREMSRNLRDVPIRTASQMVDDYYRVSSRAMHRLEVSLATGSPCCGGGG